MRWEINSAIATIVWPAILLAAISKKTCVCDFFHDKKLFSIVGQPENHALVH